MANIIPLFSTPVYVSEMQIEEHWKETIKSLDYKRMSSNDGYISHDNYVLENNSLFELKKIIQSNINNFVYEEMGYSRKMEFYITNSWITKHLTGDSAPAHDHKNSLLSGTCYIDVPENAGDFVIHTTKTDSVFPQAIAVESDKWTLFNSKTWTLTPKTGDLYIFPSVTGHSVNKSESSIPRYCLAFNVFVRGTIGEDTPDNISLLNLR